MTIPNALWLKVDRARKHMDDFQACVLCFNAEEPKPYTITPEKDGHRVRIQRQPDPAMSLIVGDFIHNLRSTLDHLVFALSGQPRKGYHSFFPVLPNPDEFTCKGKPAIRSLPPDCRALIDSLQPYQAQSPAGKQLALLNNLWNIDKHRRILLLAALPFALILKRDGPGPMPQPGTLPRWNPPEKDNVFIPAVFTKQNFEPDISLEICFRNAPKRGVPVLWVLQDLHHAVRETVLPLFEPFF